MSDAGPKIENPAAKARGRFWYQPYNEYVYKDTPQGQLKIHIHFPFDLEPSDRRPAIIFFYGGAWKAGTVEQFTRHAVYLASRGMVAARADYRVQSRHGVNIVQCVEDAKSAIRWLRANAETLNIQPDRIVGAGGSAGGHIVACAALVDGLEAADEDLSTSSRPNALVLFNPVLKPLARHIGDTVPSEEMAERLSPVLYVTKDTPPTLLMYGTEDHFGAPAPEYVEKATAAGCRAELYLAPGERHAFFNHPPWRKRTIYRADEFLASLGYVHGKPTFEAP